MSYRKSHFLVTRRIGKYIRGSMMVEFGFSTDPAAHINQLKQLLGHSYRNGFPIIKELVQNADDACATTLDICWWASATDDAHPLLRGPALIVRNDGPFLPKDLRAIRHFMLSGKATDRQAIGKFGLGLKSIFHLCEAFFLLTSENEVSPPEHIRGLFRLFNPWASDDPEVAQRHEDWRQTPLMPQGMRPAIDTLPPADRWFSLWIPLRRRDHCAGCDPIRETFPGDSDKLPDSIFGDDLASQLSLLFPMLRHLEIVRAWSQPRDGDSEKLFEVRVSDGAARCRYLRNGTTAYIQAPMQGTAIVETNDRKLYTTLFAGAESLLSGGAFDELHRSKAWPRTIAYHPVTGRPQDELEKAESHAAAYFTRRPARQEGLLNVEWAVFLPLTEKPERPITCPGSSDYTLLLHGHFFLDAGRNSIDFGNDDRDRSDPEHAVRAEWNRLLAREGTLQLILPALARFVDHAKLSDDEIRFLTKALGDSQVVKKDLPHICRDAQWAYCLTRDWGQWRLIDSKTDILRLPMPPKSSPTRHFDVFPELKSLCGERPMTFDELPILSHRGRGQWDAASLKRVLRIDVASVFADSAQLEYLVGFLNKCVAPVELEQNADALVQLALEACARAGLKQLRSLRSKFGSFVSLIPPAKRLTMCCDGGTAWAQAYETALAAIWAIPLKTFIVPSEFEDTKSHPGSATLSVVDAKAVLSSLAAVTREDVSQTLIGA